MRVSVLSGIYVQNHQCITSFRARGRGDGYNEREILHIIVIKGTSHWAENEMCDPLIVVVITWVNSHIFRSNHRRIISSVFISHLAVKVPNVIEFFLQPIGDDTHTWTVCRRLPLGKHGKQFDIAHAYSLPRLGLFGEGWFCRDVCAYFLLAFSN